METNWAENRSKIPQDIIRSTLGKVFDAAYSTGERDKYRTRLERAADGSTEIYISHRGAEEVLTGPQKEITQWTVRPNDPGLEAQFLAKLMARLTGAPDVKSTAGDGGERAGAAGARQAGRHRPAPATSKSTKASTAPGAASAWRSTASASRWKTATASTACTSCATSIRTRPAAPAS